MRRRSKRKLPQKRKRARHPARCNSSFILKAPIAWFPLSYAGCSQHAPNEHMLNPLMRERMRYDTGIYWDLGDPESAYRP